MRTGSVRGIVEKAAWSPDFIWAFIRVNLWLRYPQITQITINFRRLGILAFQVKLVSCLASNLCNLRNLRMQKRRQAGALQTIEPK